MSGPRAEHKALAGYCPGFTAVYKEFTLESTYKPCVALGNFMGNSPVVVAECEGFIHGVVFSVIRELFSDDNVFDIVFADLKLGQMAYVNGMKLFSKTDLAKDHIDESGVGVGDWVYVARSQAPWKPSGNSRKVHRAVAQRAVGT
ncbi:MAG: hypothetical protein WA324_23195 [Bryobacteraceae bacterium]